MSNINLGSIVHRLATIARTELQGYPKSIILFHLKRRMPLSFSD